MSPSSTVSTQYKPLAVYVHWPFCKKKCPYCDFNSHVRDAVDHDAWRHAMLRELHHWRGRVEGHVVTSIFFGGGTPSLMQPETARAIIDEVKALWPTTTDIEITLEANPTSVEAANFAVLADAGVNRVSLGVQSLKPESLAFLGREHSVEEAMNAVQLAADIFPRYSFDLIYALPGQTVPAWEEELKRALDHARGHLSLYQLTIEPNTAFHHQYHVQSAFKLPQEELAAELYDRTQEIMEDFDMPAYEISNHARAGQESRHNLSYWRSEAYLGIGPGAHGRVDLGAERRATNTLKSPERWLQNTQEKGDGLEADLALTERERLEERILMGLRLPLEGIQLDALPPEILRRAQPLVAQELLDDSDERLRPTPKGMLVLNAITASLLSS